MWWAIKILAVTSALFVLLYITRDRKISSLGRKGPYDADDPEDDGEQFV